MNARDALLNPMEEGILATPLQQPALVRSRRNPEDQQELICNIALSLLSLTGVGLSGLGLRASLNLNDTTGEITPRTKTACITLSSIVLSLCALFLLLYLKRAYAARPIFSQEVHAFFQPRRANSPEQGALSPPSEGAVLPSPGR